MSRLKPRPRRHCRAGRERKIEEGSRFLRGVRDDRKIGKRKERVCRRVGFERIVEICGKGKGGCHDA